MVSKIVSGGQTGADRAALDIAVKVGITHGGWIPKGRLAEDGVLDDKYQLREMETSKYNRRTEQNVIDSNGTLIISHGELTGGSEFTREMAIYHNRPWLHVDLNNTIAFQAAEKIRIWIAENEIKVLNVAGSRASKDPDIYNATADILEAAFYLDLINETLPNAKPAFQRGDVKMGMDNFPQTVEQAVDKLLTKLSLKDKTMIVNIPEEKLLDLYHSFEGSRKGEFKLWLANNVLLDSCRSTSGKQHLTGQNAALVIIKALWKKLRTTNVLRIVR